jgi:hypothetical protein
MTVRLTLHDNGTFSQLRSRNHSWQLNTYLGNWILQDNIVDGVLQIGNVFVGRKNLPSRLEKILDKFMFGKRNMSDTH